ncbi:GumC family protein [Jannaschia formosa]|uniref:GumC family protein n=1 Tax=Jannaschia formosa TaxID=2259592 RepID=UPI0014303B76|nr:polysaccharide biosynthesis tyrosine autokinase [Jannaschia formosa]
MTHEVADFEREGLSMSRFVPRGEELFDGIDPRELLSGIWAGRWIIAGCALAFAVVTYFLVSQMTPVYGSMAKILLDPRESTFVSDDQVVGDLDLSSEVVASEISILRSNVLLEDVVRTILETRPDLLEALIPSRPKDAGGGWFGFGASEPPSELQTELSDAARVDALVWALRKATEVWRDGDAYIISVYAETPDPVLSATIAGTLVERYIEQQVEGRQETASQATARIEARIADLREQVEQAEQAVEDYRASTIATNGSSIDILSQRLISLNDELVNARIERVAAETRFDEMQRLVEAGGGVALANMVTSDAIVELNARRLELQAQDAEWTRQQYREDHPERRKILARLREVEQSMEVEVARALDAQRNEARIARVREETMAEALEEVEADYLEASRSTIGLRQLERETEAVRDVYKELLTRVAETRTQENFQLADARIIERATVPGAPAAPRPKLLSAMALVVGGALGFAIVLLRRLTSRTFRDLDEVERATGLPVVTVLPESKFSSMQAAVDEIVCNPIGHTAEAVRALRNHLNAGAPDALSRSIALVSPLSGDGKTTATMLLARLAGLADEHVVVVDMDLRQDTIAREFGLGRRAGVGDLLRGDCALDEAIHSSDDLDFDVITAGRPGARATDALRMGSLTAILDELKETYDVVLVNTPALLQAPDGAVIARAVDQCVLLVRFDQTQHSAVRRCMSVLNSHEAHVEGVVMTRADLEHVPDGYLFSYGYA